MGNATAEAGGDGRPFYRDAANEVGEGLAAERLRMGAQREGVDGGSHAAKVIPAAMHYNPATGQIILETTEQVTP